MPLNYDYDEPKKLISDARLSSYKHIICSNSDAELLGAYSWNMAVVGAFYPLIQLVEVALRNAINQVGMKHLTSIPDKYWLETVQHTLTSEGKVPKQVKGFKDKIKKAHSDAKKSLIQKGLENTQPSIDQIISQTDFVTWEYIFDKHFYNGNNQQKAHCLWPHYLLKVFKKLPKVAGKNPQFHQRDIIRRRIEEIRLFRNRLSHNEPVWRVHHVKSKHDAILALTQMAEHIMELLFWISPKFKNYVVDIGIYSRITHLLNITEFERYLHISTLHEINDIPSLIELVSHSNQHNIKSHFIVGDLQGLLSPFHNKLFQ